MNKKNLYIGWDIGGAHTKYAILKPNSSSIICKIYKCNLWSSLKDLSEKINRINKQYIKKHHVINAITMSGEMSDIFSSRNEGVKEIIKLFDNLSSKNYIFVKDKGLSRYTKQKLKYLNIASMNWLAISKLLEKKDRNIIAIDVGSTTTDIILIKNFKCINKRFDDFSGLNSSELIYSGVLRTPINAIVQKIIISKREYNVIPENFATMSDVYRILSIISSKQDYTDTSDKRSKTKRHSMERLSRVFGFDYSEEKMKTLIKLSEKIMSVHLEQISCKIEKHIIDKFKNTKEIKIIGMGIGSKLIEIISKKNKWKYMGFDNYFNLTNSSSDYTPSDIAPASSLCMQIKDIHE